MSVGKLARHKITQYTLDNSFHKKGGFNSGGLCEKSLLKFFFSENFVIDDVALWDEQLLTLLLRTLLEVVELFQLLLELLLCLQSYHGIL